MLTKILQGFSKNDETTIPKNSKFAPKLDLRNGGKEIENIKSKNLNKDIKFQIARRLKYSNTQYPPTKESIHYDVSTGSKYLHYLYFNYRKQEVFKG